MSAWTVIQHIEVPSGGQASILFSSIPATYTDLLLVYSGRQETATGASVYINPNQLTTNQSTKYLEGEGSGTPASGTLARIFTADTPSNATANTFSNTMVYIPNYAGSTNKSFSIDSVSENNATTAYQRISAGLWSVTDAITSLEIIMPSGDIEQYSSATLYGIAKGSSGGVTVS
jgi:hypothetical protein